MHVQCVGCGGVEPELAVDFDRPVRAARAVGPVGAKVTMAVAAFDTAAMWDVEGDASMTA